MNTCDVSAEYVMVYIMRLNKQENSIRIGIARTNVVVGEMNKNQEQQILKILIFNEANKCWRSWIGMKRQPVECRAIASQNTNMSLQISDNSEQQVRCESVDFLLCHRFVHTLHNCLLACLCTKEDEAKIHQRILAIQQHHTNTNHSQYQSFVDGSNSRCLSRLFRNQNAYTWSRFVAFRGCDEQFYLT